MRVLSMNLNLLAPAADERAEQAMVLIMKEEPDVVALQEVSARGFFAHLKPALMAGGFVVVPHVPPKEKDDFVVLAVRRGVVATEAMSVSLPTSMGRTALVVDAQLNGQPIRLITSHLESLKGQSETRREQLSVIKESMKDRLAVFIGDTNWRDSDGPVGLKDAWVMAGRDPSHRFTWDMVKNPTYKRGRARVRFDRCWLTDGWGVESFRLVGQEVFAKFGCVSDHFGVLVDLNPR